MTCIDEMNLTMRDVQPSTLFSLGLECARFGRWVLREDMVLLGMPWAQFEASGISLSMDVELDEDALEDAFFVLFAAGDAREIARVFKESEWRKCVYWREGRGDKRMHVLKKGVCYGE